MEKVTKLTTKIYIVTANSFIKSGYAPSERPKDIKGEPIIWKRGDERLKNEAAALALIAKSTSIPVPRVLYCGPDERGVMRLEVERRDGITCEEVGEKCRMPPDLLHTAVGPCEQCAEIAFFNADYFITNTVIPQLHQLTSTTTGLNGFVLPPPRIEQYDPRDAWQVQQAPEGQNYVFCHGDLSRSNILIDPHTLEVDSIIDWEQAGYFPAELERPLWRLTYHQYMETFIDEAKIQQEIKLITQYEKLN